MVSHIQNELWSFVGLAFERLAQQWIVKQARAGALSFTPEAVGSHWSRRVRNRRRGHQLGDSGYFARGM